MSVWLVLLVLGVVVAFALIYLLGRASGLGRGEQDRGDLAEKNNQLLDTVRQLEARVIGQHARIVAMTAWETVPVGGPDRHSSLMPVRPETQPISIQLAAAEARIPRPRPRPRERRTSTSAFLSAAPVYRATVDALIDEQAAVLRDPPLIVQEDPTWLAHWRSLDHEPAAPEGAGRQPMCVDEQTCCVCGSSEVVYHNYLDQPFCWPCADGDRPAPVDAEGRTWWRKAEDEIWSARLWLAAL